MFVKDEKVPGIKGTWNKSENFTANRLVHIYGDSLPDVEQWLEKEPKRWNIDSSRSNTRSQSWDLNVGYDGALQLAKDGWSEGARDLDARLHAIIPATGRQAKYGYGLAGSRPNISRFLRGNPNHMISRQRKDFGSAPVLHIAVNTVASAAINGQQMANYGTALVGLIDRLENSGRRVHLDCMFVISLQSDKTRLSCGWNVKLAEQHVDLAQIAFAIAHPAAFRRIGFAMMERSDQSMETYGYGHCADILPCDLVNPVEGAMLLDGVNHEPSRCNSPEDALRLCIEQLNKAAVLAGHATIDNPLLEEEQVFAD